MSLGSKSNCFYYLKNHYSFADSKVTRSISWAAALSKKKKWRNYEPKLFVMLWATKHNWGGKNFLLVVENPQSFYKAGKNPLRNPPPQKKGKGVGHR